MKQHVLVKGAMAPLSQVESCNGTTTAHPVISQFRKNAHVISALLAVVYDKLEKLGDGFNGLFTFAGSYRLFNSG